MTLVRLPSHEAFDTNTSNKVPSSSTISILSAYSDRAHWIPCTISETPNVGKLEKALLIRVNDVRYRDTLRKCFKLRSNWCSTSEIDAWDDDGTPHLLRQGLRPLALHLLATTTMETTMAAIHLLRQVFLQLSPLLLETTTMIAIHQVLLQLSLRLLEMTTMIATHLLRRLLLSSNCHLYFFWRRRR